MNRLDITAKWIADCLIERTDQQTTYDRLNDKQFRYQCQNWQFDVTLRDVTDNSFDLTIENFYAYGKKTLEKKHFGLCTIGVDVVEDSYDSMQHVFDQLSSISNQEVSEEDKNAYNAKRHEQIISARQILALSTDTFLHKMIEDIPNLHVKLNIPEDGQFEFVDQITKEVTFLNACYDIVDEKEVSIAYVYVVVKVDDMEVKFRNHYELTLPSIEDNVYNMNECDYNVSLQITNRTGCHTMSNQSELIDKMSKHVKKYEICKKVMSFIGDEIQKEL